MSLTEKTRNTSYAKVKGETSKRRAAIIEILGDNEMTADEIAFELKRQGATPYYDRNFAAPRLTELKAEGKIETTGKRKCPRTGRMVAVWRKVTSK